MDYLTKISLMISLIGIIALFFVTENIDLTLHGLNNMTEENIGRTVTISGLVIKTQKYNTSFMITLKTECYMTGFYYDKNSKYDENYLNSLIKQQVTVKGQVEQKFNPSINMDSLEIID